ncbi:hypothetical protein ISCGN_014484 [Ixodes scapularis]
MRGAIKQLRCSVRFGNCATEAHSWARGGPSASAAAMTSLLWNTQTGEARSAAAAPARQLFAAVELGDVWWKTSCHTGPSGLPSPCWRPDGLFPDEADCCSFYSCASCRAYRVRCALGTVFDRRLGLCNHPHAAPTCLAPNPGCYLHY